MVAHPNLSGTLMALWTLYSNPLFAKEIGSKKSFKQRNLYESDKKINFCTRVEYSEGILQDKIKVLVADLQSCHHYQFNFLYFVPVVAEVH